MKRLIIMLVGFAAGLVGLLPSAVSAGPVNHNETLVRDDGVIGENR